MNSIQLKIFCDGIKKLIELAIQSDAFATIEKFGAGDVSFWTFQDLLFYGDNFASSKKQLSDLVKLREKIGIEAPDTHFQTKILEFISECKRGSTPIDEITTADFLHKLKMATKKKFMIIEPIYDIETSLPTPIHIGDFQIFKASSDREILTNIFPSASSTEATYFWDGLDSDYLIGLSVYAPDESQAREISRARLNEFEFAIRFLLGKLSRGLNFSIGNSGRGPVYSQIIFSKESSTTLNFQLPSGIRKLRIEAIHSGYDKFWSLFCTGNRSPLETRIFNAIIWIGKALVDHDSGRSLLQLCMALESLCQYNTKEQIRPGITQQLAEYLAFMLRDKEQERKNLFSEVKKLYNLRSKLVHGASTQVHRHDVDTLLDIAREATDWFFHNRGKIKSISDVHKWVENKKFGSD